MGGLPSGMGRVALTGEAHIPRLNHGSHDRGHVWCTLDESWQMLAWLGKSPARPGAGYFGGSLAGHIRSFRVWPVRVSMRLTAERSQQYTERPSGENTREATRP